MSDPDKFSELYYVFHHIESLRKNQKSILSIKQATPEEFKNGFAMQSKNLLSFFKDKYLFTPISGSAEAFVTDINNI